MSQYSPGHGWTSPQTTVAAWASGQAVDPPLVQIGDITVSSYWVVTPIGTRPVGETTWTVTDLSRSYRAIPGWAIVLTIITVWFFLLGLLWLLVKEDRTDGVIQVTVSAPGFAYTTTLAAISYGAVTDTHNRVNYTRSIAAVAHPRY